MSAKSSTAGPLLNGHPWDFENWPLNRGWPFNRRIEFWSLETLNKFGTLKNGRLMGGGRLKGGCLIEVLLYLNISSSPLYLVTSTRTGASGSSSNTVTMSLKKQTNKYRKCSN